MEREPDISAGKLLMSHRHTHVTQGYGYSVLYGDDALRLSGIDLYVCKLYNNLDAVNGKCFFSFLCM